MSFNYTLKYRTFQELLSDVHVDFQNMSLESMIEPQQLIKVVKRVNYDLGLRINKTQETLLEVTKGRVKLPDDFYVLNYALVCDEVSVMEGMPQGTWIEERPLITPYKMTTPGVISTCNDGTVNCCGTCSQQFGNCGCATPTCNQCTEPVASCGCSTPAQSCSCNATPCGCNLLLLPPDPCKTNTVVTNSSSSTSTTISNCCWNDLLLLQGMSMSILINNTSYSIPIGTESQMQASLNSLGLGIWTVVPGSISFRYTFCVVGTNSYESLTITSNGIPRVYDPICDITTDITVINSSIANCTCGPGCEVETETNSTSASATQLIKNCCWTGVIADGTIRFTIVINDITYTLPYTLGVEAMLDYLNLLNLGVWTLTITGITNLFVLCVTGTAIYGDVTVSQPQQSTTTSPVCENNITNTTVINVITRCKCIQPVIPPTPVVPVTPTCATTTDPCVKPRVILNCKGDTYELVQIVNPGITRTYKRLMPITILENPQMVDCGCPNLYWKSPHTAWIRDGWLYTSLKEAVIYISYQGQMQDEDGNLMCPDHDEINEYYEYAVKQRILENLVMNDEPVGQKMALVEARLRAARNYALTIVNTPNFSEMKRVWTANRTAMYGRYYNQFKSFGPVPAIVPTNNFINGYNK